MKKQINPTIKAHLIRSAFYVILLLAVCVIPFALAQRNTNKRGAANPSVVPKTKFAAGPLSSAAVAGRQSGAQRMPASAQSQLPYDVRPHQPASGGGACTLQPWQIVANYPETLESAAICTDGTFAYGAGGTNAGLPSTGFYQYDPNTDSWTTLASLPQPIRDARAVYAANTNSVYVFGGIDNNGFVSNILQVMTSQQALGVLAPTCLRNGFSRPRHTTMPPG